MINNTPEMTQAAAELQKVKITLTQRERELEDLKEEKQRADCSAKIDKINARIDCLNELRAWWIMAMLLSQIF